MEATCWSCGKEILKRKLKINAKSAGGIPATCSRSSMVEQLPCKQLAVGSNPTGGYILSFSKTSLLLKLSPQFWLWHFTWGHKKSKH